MRRLLLLALLISQISFAQTYQCLQSGAQHYFLNSNGYLRGIRIDSVRPSGSNTIYYPYHSVRGRYSCCGMTTSSFSDTSGGSWLGKRVIAEPNGSYFFDNIWQDTVIIRTQAHLGDSWIFYDDTTRRYYTATVTAVDTTTVLGSLDSVKTINILAYDDTGFVPTDPANDFKLILSKDHGFVQTFDLYTFPYHAPDTLFGFGQDYYLDYVIDNDQTWSGGIPSATNSIFKLTNFIDPIKTQLYDWNVGDALEYSICNASVTGDGSYPYEYYCETITAKTMIPNGFLYDYSGWDAVEHDAPFVSYGGTYYTSPYDLRNSSGSFIITNDLLIDSTRMPEDVGSKYIIFYLPTDSGYCSRSAKYQFISSNIQGQTFYYFGEISPLVITYQMGIGLSYYNIISVGGPDYCQDTTLLFVKLSGDSCGSYQLPSDVNNYLSLLDLSPKAPYIYPNPVHDILHVSIPDNITSASIHDVLGRQIYNNRYDTPKCEIDVSNLPTGVYYLTLNGNKTYKFVKE